MKKFKYLFSLVLVALLAACVSPGQEDRRIFNFPQLKKTQYLLTNEISMKNRDLVSGASSYLIEIDGEIYLATAKHLTTEDMGFEPALDLKSYTDSVNYWYAYPRTEILTDEIIETTDLLSDEDEMNDLILLKLKSRPKEIGVFQPNFDRLKKGDRISIIGCEYPDENCNQKQFFGTFQQYTVIDQMEIFMDSSAIALSGMSGAPLVDDQFRVVGHVMAGMIGEKGILKIYCAPVDLVKKINR